MPEHTSRSSEEKVRRAKPEAAPALEAGEAKMESRVENVPGYEKPAAPAPLAAEAAAFGEEGGPAPVDAAAVAFGDRGRVFTEAVIGADDRVAISPTTGLPWRMICALRIRCADGASLVGTGWFIGPRTVMTAGHCVYVHEHGGWPTRVEVIPGLNGVQRPFGSATGTRFRAPGGWINSQDSDFDYGAIILDQDVGQRVGFFGFGVLSDAQTRASDLNISGYPADREGASKQFFHARTVINVTAKRLVYDIDTFGGQSGSPTWLNTGPNQRIAVGIHTTGSFRSNSGTRINRAVFNNMNRWRNET